MTMKKPALFLSQKSWNINLINFIVRSLVKNLHPTRRMPPWPSLRRARFGSPRPQPLGLRWVSDLGSHPGGFLGSTTRRPWKAMWKRCGKLMKIGPRLLQGFDLQVLVHFAPPGGLPARAGRLLIIRGVEGVNMGAA